MKLIFSPDQDVLEKFLKEVEERIAAASEGAVEDAAAEMLRQGRANIARAGFSGRWREGLQARFSSRGDPSAVVFHSFGLASVFERGATISGRPLLWLPIEANVGDRIRSPRQFGGRLVSVNVAGKPPLLFAAEDRRRGPLFVGVRSVTIRKRWDLMRIFERIAARLAEFYQKRIG